MNKGRKLLAVITLLAFVAWLLFTVLSPGSTSKPKKVKGQKEYVPPFRHDGNGVLISETGDTLAALELEFAKTIEAKEYGMMYRRNMKTNRGMLFFMGEMRFQSFWMKNTYVPLDIIYIDDQFSIVSIQKNARPLNETSLPSEGPASYVLEINAGLSDKWGLKPGTKLSLYE